MPPTTIKVVRYYLGKIHGGLCYLGILFLWCIIYVNLSWTMLPAFKTLLYYDTLPITIYILKRALVLVLLIS